MEWYLELLFLYGFPVAAVALVMALIIGWLLMPPTAKLLFLKKVGFAKGGKGYILTSYDDRLIQTEAMDVFPEGAMEKKKKFGSLTFFLAKPQDETANPDTNRKNEERDRDMLPPYFLDGVLPVFLGHVSKAVATNPKILTALRLANRTAKEEKRDFEAEALLPKPVDYVNDEGEKEKVQTMPVTVILPYDPVDIKKNFPGYWQQSNIDATKKRNQGIGAEKEKKNQGEIMKMMLIVAAVACVSIVGVVVATRLLG
jgi:hypothetical protein